MCSADTGCSLNVRKLKLAAVLQQQQQKSTVQMRCNAHTGCSLNVRKLNFAAVMQQKQQQSHSTNGCEMS